MLYQTFLFLHIVGVVAWMGGTFTLTVLNLRLAREPCAGSGQYLTRNGEFLGRSVFGPAIALTLIAGIVMIGLAGWITPAWVIWGLCGLFASGFIGAVFASRAAKALARRLADGDTESPTVHSLRRRLLLYASLDLLILLSVVWAMVFKPAL
ncbi:MAG TPA: DUF2269 family protein [Oleiagrimonas sp.]|nr:DUF2269 family protein [Oleiagrimonas sp.]